MTDLRFDPDGYVDLDHYDESPLGFAERRAADRLLRDGLGAGLSEGWRSTVLGSTSADPGVLIGGPADDVDIVVEDFETHAARRRSTVDRLRLPLAAAVAALVVLALVGNALLRDNPDELDIRAPTSTITTPPPTTQPPAPETTVPPTTATEEPAPDLTEPAIGDDPGGTTSTDPDTATTAEPVDTTVTEAPATTEPPPITTGTTPETTVPPPPSVSISGPSTLAPGALQTYTATGSGFSLLLWNVSGPCQFEPAPDPAGTTAQVRAGGQSSAQPCVISVVAVAPDDREANSSREVMVG